MSFYSGYKKELTGVLNTALSGVTSGNFVINSTVTTSGDLTIPSGVTIEVLKGGTISNAFILTISGQFICGLYQAFSGAGSVVFGAGSIRTYEPVWFNSTTQPPAANGFAVGTVTKNLSPAVGQPKGWVCTVAGSPGTWVSEGNL